MRTVAFVLWVVGAVALLVARVEQKHRTRPTSILFRRDAEIADSSGGSERRVWRRWRDVSPLAVAADALALTALFLLLDRVFAPRPVPFTDSLEGTVRALTAERGVESQPSLSPDGAFVAYRRETDGAGDIVVRRVDGGEIVSLTSELGGDESDPAFSPDGRQIAFRSTRGNGGIYVADRDGGPVRRLTRIGASPAWTPDGEFIVFATRSRMDPRSWSGTSEGWKVNVRSGEMVRFMRQDFREPAVSPDGRRIAYASSVPPRPGARRISAIWTVGIDGRNPRMVSGGLSVDWSPVWSPDGAFLYFLSDRGAGPAIHRVSIAASTGRSHGEHVALAVNSEHAAHLAIAARSGQLAWSTIEWSPALFRVAFDADTRAIRGHPVAVFAGPISWKCAEPSPDGSAIAFTSDGSTPDVHVLHMTSGELRPVTHDAAAEGCPRWSPDGRRIAFHSAAGGRTRLWLADADGSNLHLAGQALGDLTNAVWSPDSRALVAWDPRASGLRLVRLHEDRRASSENLAAPPHPFTPIDWSPDGRQIAGTAAGNLWVYVLAVRSYEPLLPGSAPTWLSTSRRLLFAADGRLMMLDLPSRYTREILAVPDLHLDAPILSPDDRYVYFNQNTAEANIWLLTLK